MHRADFDGLSFAVVGFDQFVRFVCSLNLGTEQLSLPTKHEQPISRQVDDSTFRRLKGCFKVVLYTLGKGFVRHGRVGSDLLIGTLVQLRVLVFRELHGSWSLVEIAGVEVE